MKRLLCFGDSNTYGYAPYDGRYAAAIRWSGILAERLAPDWQLIEAGLNGRTIAAFDPLWPEKNGAEILPAYLRRYAPLDLLLLMLGSNDALYAPAEDVAGAMDGLLAVARREAPGCWASIWKDPSFPPSIKAPCRNICYEPATRPCFTNTSKPPRAPSGI